MTQTNQLACHECDLLVKLPELRSGYKAVCPRCHFVITRYRHNSQELLLALSLTSIIFLLMSLSFSFMTFTVQGNDRIVTLIQSIQSFGLELFWGVTLLLYITTIIVPGLFLCGIIYILVSVKLAKPLPYSKSILKVLFRLIPWNMAEIFLVGILVSLIKIVSLAKISFGFSFYAFVLFVISMTATLMVLDRFQLWQWINQKYGKKISVKAITG